MNLYRIFNKDNGEFLEEDICKNDVDYKKGIDYYVFNIYTLEQSAIDKLNKALLDFTLRGFSISYMQFKHSSIIKYFLYINESTLSRCYADDILNIKDIMIIDDRIEECLDKDEYYIGYKSYVFLNEQACHKYIDKYIDNKDRHKYKIMKNNMNEGAAFK